jgi:hypothetical protein
MEKIKSYYDYLKEEEKNNFENLIQELAQKNIAYSQDFISKDDKEYYQSYLSSGLDIYSPFLKDILNEKKIENNNNLILTLVNEDVYVHILNKNFVEEPDYSKKMWGGNFEDKNDCPEGHININWDGYQKYYAVGWKDFQNIIFNEILIEDDCWEKIDRNIHKAMAEVTFELTFYGIESKERKMFDDKINDSLQDIKLNKLKTYDFNDIKQRLIERLHNNVEKSEEPNILTSEDK